MMRERKTILRGRKMKKWILQKVSEVRQFLQTNVTPDSGLNAARDTIHVICHAADSSPHSFDGKTVSENADPIIALPLHSTATEYAAEAVSV